MKGLRIEEVFSNERMRSFTSMMCNLYEYSLTNDIPKDAKEFLENKNVKNFMEVARSVDTIIDAEKTNLAAFMESMLVRASLRAIETGQVNEDINYFIKKRYKFQVATQLKKIVRKVARNTFKDAAIQYREAEKNHRLYEKMRAASKSGKDDNNDNNGGNSDGNGGNNTTADTKTDDVNNSQLSNAENATQSQTVPNNTLQSKSTVIKSEREIPKVCRSSSSDNNFDFGSNNNTGKKLCASISDSNSKKDFPSDYNSYYTTNMSDRATNSLNDCNNQSDKFDTNSSKGQKKLSTVDSSVARNTAFTKFEKRYENKSNRVKKIVDFQNEVQPQDDNSCYKAITSSDRLNSTTILERFLQSRQENEGKLPFTNIVASKFNPNVHVHYQNIEKYIHVNLKNSDALKEFAFGVCDLNHEVANNNGKNYSNTSEVVKVRLEKQSEKYELTAEKNKKIRLKAAEKLIEIRIENLQKQSKKEFKNFNQFEDENEIQLWIEEIYSNLSLEEAKQILKKYEEPEILSDEIWERSIRTISNYFCHIPHNLNVPEFATKTFINELYKGTLIEEIFQEIVLVLEKNNQKVVGDDKKRVQSLIKTMQINKQHDLDIKQKIDITIINDNQNINIYDERDDTGDIIYQDINIREGLVLNKSIKINELQKELEGIIGDFLSEMIEVWL